MNLLKRILPIILIVAGAIVIVSSVPIVESVKGPQEDFCGVSTNGTCETNADCIEAGCSGSTCQSVDEEDTVSTCEWKDCYDNEKYDLSCQCVEGKCMWSE